VTVSGGRVSGHAGSGTAATPARKGDRRKRQARQSGRVDPHCRIGQRLGAYQALDDYKRASVAALWGGTTTVVDFAIPDLGRSPLEACGNGASLPKSTGAGRHSDAAAAAVDLVRATVLVSRGFDVASSLTYTTVINIGGLVGPCWPAFSVTGSSAGSSWATARRWRCSPDRVRGTSSELALSSSWVAYCS
jgi:hypothetical protein